MKLKPVRKSEQFKRALRTLEGKYNAPKYLGRLWAAIKIDEANWQWNVQQGNNK